MQLPVIAAVFPLVFLGELPDKTMFASLVLASRGRPVAVWVGTALSFAAHVVIAVSVGVALFDLLPHRVLDGLVAAAFFGGAVYSFLTRNGEDESTDTGASGTRLRAAATAAAVIFLAEWGDLTQVITADLAARYHDPLSVGVAALAALLAVAALAVGAGSNLLRVVSVRVLRTVTAVVLVGLGAWALVGVF